MPLIWFLTRPSCLSVLSTFQNWSLGLTGVMGITHSSGIIWVALPQSWAFSRVTLLGHCCSFLGPKHSGVSNSTRVDCAGLICHAWYLDDGALAGPRSSVRNVLALLQELGPLLGLHVKIHKVFSHSSLDISWH